MNPNQLHTYLKLYSLAGPVLESLKDPTADAFIWKRQRKAVAMLVDLGTEISVADGALSFAGYVCKLLAPYRVEAENICWIYRDAQQQWGSFELRDRAAVFGQVPRQSRYGAIDFALDFLGHKGTAPLDLVEFTRRTREQRLAYATQHWIAAARLH
ncbi:hypothetical protein [Azotobacter beijerinckii]|uniref:Uncharacterized protein n=1 Tax=Azotobacter beijerinckii TaxID=170623 RepID=A0A1I4IN18_9GAMM|nr:hypothetical protein [Azotobacter beijerinckii]SFB65431.1 hypothetical protein SAMN04244571_04824 [Azotobacter beijerinckii]SFL55742.1 hypothetical protein SAMN04244574_04648 [Azotobacter beijerinckii]